MSQAGASLPSIRKAIPGERARAYLDILEETECPAFTARRARRAGQSGASHDPIVWAEAIGSNVIDADGNVFVDLISGFGASLLGHRDRAIVSAIQAQSEKLIHALGDVHPSVPKLELLKRLKALAPMPDARVLLSLSGSDAVEAALKTAVLHTKKPGILAFNGAYHGLAHGPLAACGYSRDFRAPFEAQLNPESHFISFPEDSAGAERSLEEARSILRARPIGAILVEPILGRGGIYLPPPGFLSALQSLGAEFGALFIVDEIFTGIGRTGSFLRVEAEGLTPDLLCLGKGLGGGMPVSACIGSHEVMAAWGDPVGEAIHTGTFFGHPLGAAAALAVLDAVEERGLVRRAGEVGDRFKTQVETRLQKKVRGAGLFLAIELGEDGKALELMPKLLERGYLVLPAGRSASGINLTPALTIDEALLDAFIETLGELLEGAR